MKQLDPKLVQLRHRYLNLNTAGRLLRNRQAQGEPLQAELEQVVAAVRRVYEETQRHVSKVGAGAAYSAVGPGPIDRSTPPEPSADTRTEPSRLDQKHQEKLLLPPGHAVAEWLRAIFGQRVYERLLEQHIVDHAEEWADAHASKRFVLVKWIRVRCWVVLLWSVLGALPIEQIRALLTGTNSKKKSAD